MLVQKKSVRLRPHKHILIVDLFVCFLYSFGTFDIVDGTYRIVLYMCYWKNFDNLTLVCKPKLKTLLFVLSKNLRLDKHILIKWTYSRYGIYSLPQSLGFAPVAGACVCVYMCPRPPHPTGPRPGLLWADGHNYQSTESSSRGQGGVALSHYVARLISATWTW